MNLQNPIISNKRRLLAITLLIVVGITCAVFQSSQAQDSGGSQIYLPLINSSVSHPITSTTDITNTQLLSSVYTLTESRFRYAPLIDDFSIRKWADNVNSSINACKLGVAGTKLDFADAVHFISSQSGINPRVLIILGELKYGLLSQTNFDCTKLNNYGDKLYQSAKQMMQATLIYRFGQSDEPADIPATVLAQRTNYPNDVSFAIAAEIEKMAFAFGISSLQLRHHFYEVYGKYFGNPESTPPYVEQQMQAAAAVDFKMPFLGSRYYTSGPHGGGSITSCVHINVGDASGLDFGGVDNPNNPFNAPVLAIADGTVVGLKNTESSPGRWVAIHHENGIVSMYWHLSTINPHLHPGQHLISGAYLGEKGDTGCPGCSPHIHLELRMGGEDYNQWSGIGSPVTWNARIMDGWIFYSEFFSDGKIANYNGSAIGNGALSQQVKRITACGDNVDVSVEGGFPYDNETNTDKTKFAFSQHLSSLSSTNVGSCPAGQINLVYASSTTGFCGDISTPTSTPPPTSVPPPSSNGIEIVSVSNHNVQPGQQFNPSVTIRVQSGQLLVSRGDHLHAIPEDTTNTLGAWPVQAVKSNINAGGTYTFDVNNDSAFRMTAPSTPGNYVSRWQLRVDGNHIGPVIEIPITVGSATTPPRPSGWRAQYWSGYYSDNPWGNGRCKSDDYTDSIPFTKYWGGSGPGSSCNPERFSVLYERRFDFSGGRYRFHCHRDGYCRIFIPELGIDHAEEAGSFAGMDWGVDIPPGNWEVKIEYSHRRENGDSRLEFWWQGPDSYLPPLDVNCTTNPYEWCAAYRVAWNSPTDSYILRRFEGFGYIDHNWGSDSPGYGVYADFSAEWSRLAKFDAGLYRFHVIHDEGAKVVVDNKEILNQWGTCCREDTSDVWLSSGDHRITVNWFDSSGNANLKVWWEKITACYQLNTQVEPLTAGNITFDPAPNCPIDGTKYTAGTTVNVQAQASADYNFWLWRGEVNDTTNPATVVMNWDRTLTAYFSANPTATPAATNTPISMPTNTPIPSSPTPMTCTGRITGLALFDINTGQPIPGYNPISNGATINLASLPNMFNLEAITSGMLESIQFNVNGATNLQNDAPYRSPEDTTAWSVNLGGYSISATAFSQDNASGIVCDTRSLTINFVTPTATSTNMPVPPTTTSTATNMPAVTPTATPTIGGSEVELLTQPWHLVGNNGAAEAYQSIPPNVLQGKNMLRVTYNLHGLKALGADASAIIFDQNGWRYISLSNYGQNGKDGVQTANIPLSAFPGLNPNASVGTLHTRFWYSKQFVVDITSIVAYSSQGQTPTPASTRTNTPAPTLTSTPTSANTPVPTPTPTSAANGVELLTSAWRLVGNNGAAEAYQSIPSNVLQGKNTLRITYNLHGLQALGGDASAIIFDQNGWRYISLSNYGQNGKDGVQTVNIPLSNFPGLNPSTGVGTLHTRFWYSQPFTVDITSIVAYSTVSAAGAAETTYNNYLPLIQQ